MRFLRPFALALSLAPAMLASSCWLTSPTGLDGFVEAFLRADCHFAFVCCAPPERAQFFQRDFRDEGTCVSEGLEEGSGGNVVIDRAKAVIAAGKGEFNQERADECLKPVLDARNNCDADVVIGGAAPADPVCAAEQARGFVVGNVDDGDECNDDIECADFGVCDRSGNDADVITTSGECKAARPEGEECIDDEGNIFACFPGTFCQADGAEFTCQEFELLDDGEPCFDDTDCESGSCNESEVFVCSFTGDPCTVATEAVDCPGDFCEQDFQDVCGENDLTVEVCDGQE